MPYFLIEVRDSDGNDCTVYDAIVQAPDKAAASTRLWAELGSWYPDDEDDGGYGTYHACTCECEHGCSPWDDDAPGHKAGRCGDTGWECSHGGLLTDEDSDGAPREYATEAKVRAVVRRRGRRLIDLTEGS